MADASVKRILIVDDEPDPRDLLASCIEYSGFNVDTAVDGVEALEKVQANPPDLMILDMRMPRKSGSRLIRTLQRDERWARIPLIAISGHARNQYGYVKIEGVDPCRAENHHENIAGKTTTPGSLVRTIGAILGVNVEDGDGEDRAADADEDIILKLDG
jgi:CheY-like chemotaxis protein